MLFRVFSRNLPLNQPSRCNDQQYYWRPNWLLNWLISIFPLLIAISHQFPELCCFYRLLSTLWLLLSLTKHWLVMYIFQAMNIHRAISTSQILIIPKKICDSEIGFLWYYVWIYALRSLAHRFHQRYWQIIRLLRLYWPNQMVFLVTHESPDLAFPMFFFFPALSPFNNPTPSQHPPTTPYWR